MARVSKQIRVKTSCSWVILPPSDKPVTPLIESLAWRELCWEGAAPQHTQQIKKDLITAQPQSALHGIIPLK